jgi:heat shock protein HslJ
MKIKLIYLIASLAILLSACASADSISPDGTPLESTSLDGTSWELFAISKHRPIEGTNITLSFEDGLARGSSGCNTYGSAYQVNGDQIEFQEFESTLMDCVEPTGVMEQEIDYLDSLGYAQRFEIVDGQLLIHWSDHEAFTFIPVE